MAVAGISFPYPVLGNRDDILVGQVDPAVDYTIVDEQVTVKVKGLSTGNPTIEGLIAASKAIWGLRFQCNRTYFRKTFTTGKAESSWNFSATDLDGRVALTVFLSASETIPSYSPEGLHPDYGDSSFTVNPGEILALGSTFEFSVDKTFDPLRAPVASLMRVSRGEHADGPFHTVFEEDLIDIRLSAKDWSEYPGVRDRTPGLVHSALVLPVLVEALHQLNSSANDGTRWADRLRAIATQKDVDLSDPLRAAQELLGYPVARGFLGLNRRLDAEG